MYYYSKKSYIEYQKIVVFAVKLIVYHSRYQQKFDLEGDTGIVVRGIGTAMTLTKLSSNPDKNLAPGSTMATTTMMGATNKDDPQQKT